MTDKSNGAPMPQDMATFVKQAQQQAKAVLQKIPLLGPVAWLMMQQTATRHALLSELEWRVLPPLVLDQAKLYMRDEAPVAYVSWAFLSQEAATRYAGAPHHLSPADWKSGGEVWVIDVVAPFGGVKEVIEELRTKIFPGKVIRQLVPAPAGEASVLAWPPIGS